MGDRRRTICLSVGLIAIVSAGIGYALWHSNGATPIIGIVRATEIRLAPEVGGQLAAIEVHEGDRVRVGDVVARLLATELNAAVLQARAALNAAQAQRDHVYAGVRAEEVAALAAAIQKAKSRLDYAQSELERKAQLVPSSAASQQDLDNAEHDAAAARADVAEAQANYAAAVAGPTREQRAIADSQVEAAAAALGVLERRLEKTTLRAPARGIVTVIVAELGENMSAGQPVLTIAAENKPWLSFNVREDRLHGLTVGGKVQVARAGGEPTPAVVSEITPLGSFATWQAERAVGDHDRSTLRLRLDPQAAQAAFEPGMTVWIDR